MTFVVFCKVYPRITNLLVTELSRCGFYNRYWTLIATYAPTMTNSPEKKSSFNDQLNLILHSLPKAEKSSFWRTLTLELANQIIPSRRFLVSMKRRRLIQMAICCNLFAKNTTWSLPTPTSNTMKFTRTPGWAKDPNTGVLSTKLSHDSMICQTFCTQERWSSPLPN